MESSIMLISILGGMIVCLTIAMAFMSLKMRKVNKVLASFKESHNESYVKFLSDSRNQAYQYIEEVQEELTKFRDRVEPQLKYFNTYGKIQPSPHTIIVEEIDSAYGELNKIMPQEK